MAEHFCDFRERGAAPNHPRGQAVSKQVGHTPRARAYARASERQADDVIDRTWTRQADAWRDDAEKYASRDTGATAMLEVSRDGTTDVGEQRHMVASRSFTANDDLAGTPVKVAELKKDDFARAQPKSGQEEQDRRIAPCGIES